MIIQADEPKKASLPLLKTFEDSTLALDIEGDKQVIDLSERNLKSLLFGCSRHNDQYGKHCAYWGCRQKERPFIKRLGSFALPDNLNIDDLQNKRVKLELKTRPSFRAPTLNGSWHANEKNDQNPETVNGQIEPLTMIAEVDFEKVLKDTTQGQYVLIDKGYPSNNQSHDDLAQFGLKNQGTGHIEL